MKQVYFGTLILLTSVCGFLTGCSDDDSASSASTANGSSGNTGLGPSTPTGIVTHRDFRITFDPIPVVFDAEGYHGNEEVTVVINADDINDLDINGRIVNIRTEWGTFVGDNKDSCVLTNGSCSVTWIPGSMYTAPTSIIPVDTADYHTIPEWVSLTTPPVTVNELPESQECKVAFVAWTEGEEKFADQNQNGLFDLGEPFTDLPEPYLDIDESGIYLGYLRYKEGWGTAATPSENASTGFCNEDGVCEFIDVNNDGKHNLGNDQYDGSLCASGNTQCSGVSSTTIWTASYLPIGAEFYDHDNDSATPNIAFCGGAR